MGTPKKQLVQKYHCETALNKNRHNQVMKSKNNIQVLCRVRPDTANDKIVVTPSIDDDATVNVAWKGTTRTLKVDKVFWECSTQEQVIFTNDILHT